MAGLAAQDRPHVLVNASGIDYYGDVQEDMVDESSPAGDSFLALVCRQWQAEAERATGIGVHVNMLRTAAVLSPSAMPLNLLALPFRLWIGGPLGSGKQFFSWISCQARTRHIGSLFDGRGRQESSRRSSSFRGATPALPSLQRGAAASSQVSSTEPSSKFMTTMTGFRSLCIPLTGVSRCDWERTRQQA
jgi:hypothetical protein